MQQDIDMINVSQKQHLHPGNNGCNDMPGTDPHIMSNKGS